jgi:hypothetical protein
MLSNELYFNYILATLAVLTRNKKMTYSTHEGIEPGFSLFVYPGVH